MTETAKQVNSHVGTRIRERRVMMGVTMQELARDQGISYQQLHKYETNANRISIGALYGIAQRLDVNLDYFVVGLEPLSDSSSDDHGGKNRPTISLARNFAKIKDPETQKILGVLIKNLADDGTEEQDLEFAPLTAILR